MDGNGPWMAETPTLPGNSGRVITAFGEAAYAADCDSTTVMGALLLKVPSWMTMTQACAEMLATRAEGRDKARCRLNLRRQATSLNISSANGRETRAR